MKLETKVFEFCSGKYANLSELPSGDPDEKKTITRSLKQRRRPTKDG